MMRKYTRTPWDWTAAETLAANPLPQGLHWQSIGGPYGSMDWAVGPDESGNPFALMEQGRQREIWLETVDEGINPKIGDKIRCWERGGSVTVTVEAILQHEGQTWVRGEWSDGWYLPVEEFMAELPTARQIAEHKPFGATRGKSL